MTTQRMECGASAPLCLNKAAPKRRTPKPAAWREAFLIFCCLGFSGCEFNGPRPDGSGTIECTQVEVSALVPGRILRMASQEGDAVKKGERVAQLDAADHELRRNEARAALGVALAQLELLKAGSRAEDIERARAHVREAKAAAVLAAADLQRVEKVFHGGSATRKQLDDALARAEQTAAALAAAEQQQAKLAKGNRDEEIRLAEAQAEQAKARLAQLEKAVADCTVAAPMDGVVTTRSREEGEFAPAGAPLLTLSRLDEVWLSIYVPEKKMSSVRIGQRARVRADGDPRFFEGTVTFVSPEAEFTPRNTQTPEERAKLVYRLKITLPNAEGVFKPGMQADGFLEGKR